MGSHDLSTQTIVACGLFAFLFVIYPIVIAAIILRSLHTGVFPENRFAPPYHRETQPIRFWFQITYYTAVALGLAGCGVFIGAVIWANPQ